MRRAYADVCLIVLFMSALFAPTVDRYLRPDSARGPEERELRRAATRPEFELSRKKLLSFPQRYTDYFNDSLGLRDRFLRWRSIGRLFVFGVSPSPTAIMGKDGWIFLATMSSMEIFRGVSPLTTPELERWRRALESQRDYLARRGIEYVYVIAPNKESIYPDYVSPTENRVGPTRMDQLVAYLEEHSDFRILDLRPALIAARAEDRPDDHLYFEVGTHWKGRGSWVASCEVLRRLRERFPAMPPIDPSEVKFDVGDDYGDSLAQGMYIEDLVPQRLTWFGPIGPRRARQLSPGWDEQHPRRLEVSDPDLPRALIFHDSFGPAIELVVGDRCRHSAWFNESRFDTFKIEAEAPDVLITLYVERVFADPCPEIITDPPVGRSPTTVDGRDAERVRFRLDPKAPAIELKARGGTVLEHGRDDEDVDCISVVMREGSDTFLLPQIDWPMHGRVVVEVDITTPIPTFLTLFYLSFGATEYSRQSSSSAPLVAGRNRIALEIEAGGLRGRLMIRPGVETRRYLLHSLVVRTLPRR